VRRFRPHRRGFRRRRSSSTCPEPSPSDCSSPLPHREQTIRPDSSAAWECSAGGRRFHPRLRRRRADQRDGYSVLGSILANLIGGAILTAIGSPSPVTQMSVVRAGALGRARRRDRTICRYLLDNLLHVGCPSSSARHGRRERDRFLRTRLLSGLVAHHGAPSELRIVLESDLRRIDDFSPPRSRPSTSRRGLPFGVFCSRSERPSSIAARGSSRLAII